MNDLASSTPPVHSDTEPRVNWGDPSNIDFRGTTSQQVDVTIGDPDAVR